jgi:hypothetical protein
MEIRPDGASAYATFVEKETARYHEVLTALFGKNPQ